MVKLTGSIWYMEPREETDRPVLAVIKGRKRALMVDGANSPRHAAEFLDGLRDLELAQPQLIAITHAHCDHIFGLELLTGLVIANNHTNDRMRELGRLRWDDVSVDARVQAGMELKSTSDMLKVEMPGDRADFHIHAADIIFRDHLEVDLGNLNCQVERVGGGHTRDSTVICVPSLRVTFLGDCLYCKERDEAVLNELCSKLLSLEADVFVDSHMSKPIMRKDLRDMLFA